MVRKTVEIVLSVNNMLRLSPEDTNKTQVRHVPITDHHHHQSQQCHNVSVSQRKHISLIWTR